MISTFNIALSMSYKCTQIREWMGLPVCVCVWVWIFCRVCTEVLNAQVFGIRSALSKPFIILLSFAACTIYRVQCTEKNIQQTMRLFSEVMSIQNRNCESVQCELRRYRVEIDRLDFASYRNEIDRANNCADASQKFVRTQKRKMKRTSHLHRRTIARGDTQLHRGLIA